MEEEIEIGEAGRGWEIDPNPPAGSQRERYHKLLTKRVNIRKQKEMRLD